MRESRKMLGFLRLRNKRAAGAVSSARFIAGLIYVGRTQPSAETRLVRRENLRDAVFL